MSNKNITLLNPDSTYYGNAIVSTDSTNYAICQRDSNGSAAFLNAFTTTTVGGGLNVGLLASSGASYLLTTVNDFTLPSSGIYSGLNYIIRNDASSGTCTVSTSSLASCAVIQPGGAYTFMYKTGLSTLPSSWEIRSLVPTWFTFPTSVPGSNGYILSSTTAGVTSWVAPPTGTVTGVTATGPIASSGGAAPVISLSTSGAVSGQAMIYNGTGAITTSALPTGTVTGVTATGPIASSGGAAPVISLNTSGAVSGQAMIYNGTSAITTVSLVRFYARFYSPASSFPAFSGKTTQVCATLNGGTNTGSAYNTSTGVFTCPNVGIYTISGVIYLDSSVSWITSGSIGIGYTTTGTAQGSGDFNLYVKQYYYSNSVQAWPYSFTISMTSTSDTLKIWATSTDDANMNYFYNGPASNQIQIYQNS